ncbi:MAG: thiol reductant ABC exporter subunit CydC [Anaerolineaceae bacterium]|nr:thiol reductant ABC exporter subunit CydC [Anaerolineaceae bacterium]
MKTLLRLASFMKPFVKEIALSILTGIVTIGTGIGMLGTSAYLISYAALQPSIAELQVAIVGVRFFGITRSIFRYLERLVSHSVNLRLLAKMRVWFYRSLEPGAPANLQQQRGGDLLNRVMADLETLENFYVRVVAPVIVAIVITIGMPLFLGGYFWPLALILFSGMFLNGFVVPFLMILVTRKTGRQSIETRSLLSSIMLETFQGLEDLQAAGAEGRWLQQIRRVDERSARLQVFYGFLTGLTSGLALLVTNFTVLAVLWAAIPQVSLGNMSGVSMAVVTLLTMASFEATGNLPTAAQNLTASYAAAKRLFELAVPVQANGALPDLPEETIQRSQRLEVKDMQLSYPASSAPALNCIDLTLERGERIAVVGPSGAGKSSLANALLRFWPVQKGQICVDGRDLNGYSEPSTRRLFGVISQSTYIFSETLRENLLLAAPDAKEERLLDVLHQARLDDWLSSLPEGLNTWLGDQGVQMSGGERQRLAIARVLLQETPFVILDEPTANLDPETEAAILTQLFEVFSDRGLLIITHRLVQMEKMARIYFIKAGEVLESGTQVDLLAQKGAYRHFFDLQKNILSDEFSV